MCLTDDVASWLLVTSRVNEVADTKSENGAVGEELVKVGVGVAGWLLGLVLGVDDGDRRIPHPPDNVRLERDLSRDIEVMPRLSLHMAAEGGFKRLLERDRYEVLE